jgi:transposase
MGRRRSLSNNDRNKALEMLQSGLFCRNIAGTFGVAPSTISRVFSRFNATNSVCDSASSGGTRVTKQSQDKFIRTLSLNNRTLNARTLTHELRTTAGVNVSDQTIRNRLHSRKLGPRRPVVRIPLTLHHRRLGLDWCRRHLPWTARQCSTVAFRTNHDSM